MAVIANLLQPMSLGRKLVLLVVNLSIKVRGLQLCCNNLSQPGC